MAKLNKQEILDSVARCIDVVNAQADDPPAYQVLCGGGAKIADCTWFIALGLAGTEMGEMFRSLLTKQHATAPHYQHVDSQSGKCKIRESSERELPGG